MKKQLGLIIGLAASMSLSFPANSAQDAPRMPVTTASVEQKMSYFEHLVEKGVAATLITNSGSAEDKQVLEDARALVKEALADMEAGQNEVANEKLNDALSMITSKVRALVGGEGKKKRQTKAYQDRKSSVEGFVTAYNRIAEEKSIGAKASANVSQVQEYITTADSSLAAGSLEEARSKLDVAYVLITGYIAEARQGDTLIRELKFDTPKDEYLYEVDRNESLFGILELTLKEKPQNDAQASTIEGLKAEAESLRHVAEKQAGNGEYVKAMETLSKSNSVLVKSVRMAGLFIPG